MKLEKFDKNKKRKVIVVSVVLGLFLIIGGVYLFRSHAIFEEHKTFDVIFGKVPPFKKKEKDLELAILVDGESVSEVPQEEYYYVTVECDTDEISGEWNYSTKKAHISGDITKQTVCTINFKSIFNDITIDGEKSNNLPTEGDYQYNMTCSNVSNDYTTTAWPPKVSGINANSSCDISFRSTESIISKIIVNEKEESSYPEKGTIGFSNYTCTTEGTILDWDNENWRPVIKNITDETTCEIEFSTKVNVYENANVGDYVAYTPSSTIYEITSSLTGCTGTTNKEGYTGPNTYGTCKSNQVINPSELNLWRVIKKNEDGTIEIVSEYIARTVLNENIYFYGREGYLKFVGSLNTIASQYETDDITTGSRHVGFTGETLECSDVLSCGNSSSDLISADTKLLNVAYGGNINCYGDCESLKSNWASDNVSNGEYWLASRRVSTRVHPFDGYTYYTYFGNMVTEGGTISGHGLGSGQTKTSISASGLTYNVYGSGIRPVVTLKSGLTATEGSKNGKKLWTIN